MGATQISTNGRVYAARNAKRNVSLGESEAAAVKRLEEANVNDQASYNQSDLPASDEARQLAAELGLPLAIQHGQSLPTCQHRTSIPPPGPRPDSLPAQRPPGCAGPASIL